MALQEGTYTWEYGDTTQALWFTTSYNTVTNKWTVDMKKGSMDLNALWWSNGDSKADGAINLLSKDNSLNMNGTGIVWDGYDKISDTGLTGKEHNGSSLLTAGNTYTYSYSKDQGVEIESLLAQGVVVLGIRATSVNGTDGIKAVDGQYVFVPYDNTPPTVTVDIVDASLNDGDNSSQVTFQFSEAVTGFTVGDVSVSGGTLSNFTQVDGDTYQAKFTATDGVETTGSVSVAAASYTDVAGNTGGAGADTVTIDTKNPTLAVNIVDASLNDGDNSSQVTFQFSEDVTGFTVGDVSVSGGTLSNFTPVDGNSYTATFTADDGVETIGSVSVAAASYSDVAGNTGAAGADTVTIDTKNPTLTVDIVDASLNDATNSSLVSFEFSEDVTGFSDSDVNVSGGTLSDFTQVDGNSYTATFTADDGVETIGSVSVAAASYTDVAGNTGAAGADTVTIDTLNPTLTVDIVDASLNDGTNSSLVSFEFSEDVSGFADSDVNVSGGTLSDFTQVDGNSYTATFTADDGVETIGSVSVTAASYSDVAGNTGGAGTDTVTIDTKNPTLTVDIVDTSLNDGDNSSLVSFEFSEDVTGFSDSDVNVSGGTLSDFTQVDGNSYQAIFTATDGVETTGSVSVAAASYTDVAGNTGAAGADTVTIDTKNPTLTVDIVDASLNDATNSSLVSFEFSEDVTGFSDSDVNVSGGTLSDFTQVDGNSYQAIFTATDGVETTGSVSVAAASYSDVAGNTGAAGADTVTIDTKNPTLTVDIVDASLNDATNSSLVTFQFSETVSGFTVGDVSVSGGTLSDFTQVDGNSYQATFTATDGVETTGSVSVAAASYTDVAGNTGAAGTDTVTIDTLNPTLAVDIVDASLNDATNSSLVSFEFSEDVTGFSDSDVNVSGGTLSDFTQVDGNSYQAIFTATDGVETTGSVSVAAASYTDVAGNTGAAGTDTVTIDTLNPTVGITFDSSTLTGQNFSTTVNFQFSEAVSGFTASDVTLTNGVLSNFTGSGGSYTATFTATNFQNSTGTVAVSNDYFDTAGNQGVANSANIALTVGGGSDPNDGPSGGDSVIGSGTIGADSITGSTGDDNLSGLDGADTINGGDGNDTIDSGINPDIIRGGTGNDTIFGRGAADVIYGGSGNDSLTGNNDNDTIVGGFGNDSLIGGGGNDTFQFLSIYDQQDVITDFGIDTIVFNTTGASAFTSLGSGALGTTTYTGAIAGGYLTYSGGVLSYDADGSAGSTFSPLAIVTLTGSPALSNTNVLFQAL